jgi:hypothetical protein
MFLGHYFNVNGMLMTLPQYSNISEKGNYFSAFKKCVFSYLHPGFPNVLDNGTSHRKL